MTDWSTSNRPKVCYGFKPERDKAMWRKVSALKWCGCVQCQGVVPDLYAYIGCDCPWCAVALLTQDLIWADGTTVNVCDCCGTAWVAHSRASVCPECWEKDLCRVCWGRPGVVCSVCAAHLATPYSEDQ